ncbi:hypothetical protein FNV43_RR03513 [Rhamnella rubrinervis]|uniref:Uncharacterized protein n=1 Tax=Rhamnella rubrinervis TaxID=2594499 RepID=A0A8K0MP57_9ROSA|nr:hypothetical protein FNV43_RR03513 [Rhamnella rubrinervis]
MTVEGRKGVCEGMDLGCETLNQVFITEPVSLTKRKSEPNKEEEEELDLLWAKLKRLAHVEEEVENEVEVPAEGVRITLDLAMDSNNTNNVLNRALDSNKKLESAFVVTKQKKLKIKAEAWIWKTKLALFEETLKSIKARLQATVSF